MGYQHKQVEGRITVPSPLRNLHEDRFECHCFRLRMTQEHTRMRNNNFSVGNLANQLNDIVIASATSIYSKNNEHAKTEIKVHINDLKTYFSKVGYFYSNTYFKAYDILIIDNSTWL